MNSNPLFGFLYAQPSFLEGVARALDLGGTMTQYNDSLNGEQADYLAIMADWRVVGYDLHRALLECARERIAELNQQAPIQESSASTPTSESGGSVHVAQSIVSPLV